MTRAEIEEDDNAVILEVEGVEHEFPLHEASHNNNATVSTDDTQVEKRVSRADRFREMVNSASKQGNMDLNQESSEEGETRSSEDEDGISVTSSVKILPRSLEEIEKEEAEFAAERDKFLDQAVDKTFEKLTQFMKNSGIVFSQQSNQMAQTKERVQQTNSNRKSGKNNGGKTLPVSNFSETTIYDTAIKPANDSESEVILRLPGVIEETQETNSTVKRISTSSEELGNTSDEMEGAANNLNNLSIFTDAHDNTPARDQDHFYAEPPVAGGSGTHGSKNGNDYRAQPRQANHSRVDQDKVAEREARQ